MASVMGSWSVAGPTLTGVWKVKLTMSRSADSMRSLFLTIGFQALLTDITEKARGVIEARLDGARQQRQALQYLQMQQQQLGAMQAQMQVSVVTFLCTAFYSVCALKGANSPWNFAMAYRIPDTNININCNYQQGKSNVQVSCVPDESIGLLGANGTDYDDSVGCVLVDVFSLMMSVYRIRARGHSRKFGCVVQYKHMNECY
jgi:hypothetical protein